MGLFSSGSASIVRAGRDLAPVSGCRPMVLRNVLVGTLGFCFGTAGVPRVDFGGSRRVFGEEVLKIPNFDGWELALISRIALASM